MKLQRIDHILESIINENLSGSIVKYCETHQGKKLFVWAWLRCVQLSTQKLKTELKAKLMKVF